MTARGPDTRGSCRTGRPLGAEFAAVRCWRIEKEGSSAVIGPRGWNGNDYCLEIILSGYLNVPAGNNSDEIVIYTRNGR